MVLDAISALGLAGNIVQFVQFGCALVAESQDIYCSATGTSTKSIELELIATDLHNFSESLTASVFKGSVSIIGNDEDMLNVEVTVRYHLITHTLFLAIVCLTIYFYYLLPTEW